MFKPLRLFNTLKFLKPTQVKYRLYYLIRSKIRKLSGFSYALTKNATVADLVLTPSIPTYESYHGENTFCFLNKTHQFDTLDWNYHDEGHLWAFNLTYFDFINQEDINQEDALILMHDFVDQIENISFSDGLAAYTISLRGINWIKFFVKHGVYDKKLDDSLYAQYHILLDTSEYQFLGNHLLENGFSLLFGAYYFQDEVLYAKAKDILLEQLAEQTLADGGNFELSPMYHQILLWRLLDCVNLVKNNTLFDQELLPFLSANASDMLAWINNITFSSGEIPLLNDSTNKIAPTTEMINDYAKTLDIQKSDLVLKESGYRKITKQKYEMVVDVADIGAEYIPAHAQSDTFTFSLYVDGKPFIVDTGTSTYEKNQRRHIERSTFSHNTVEVGEKNQSEVWSGFRVADRAYIVELEEKEDYIRAIHDGYKKRFSLLHQREFITKDKSINIIDKVLTHNKIKSIARLHFYPGIELSIHDGYVMADGRKINLVGAENVMIKIYRYAPEYNKLIEAKVLDIEFYDILECEIEI